MQGAQGARPWGVVVVDDNQTDLGLMRQVFGHAEGFEVLASCSDGISGIAAARETVPDLVVCDIFLGDGPDGFAVLEELQDRGIPVVLISVDSSMRDLARASSAAGFIDKARSPARWIAICREAIERTQHRPAPLPPADEKLAA